jgi:hypothetical protein
MGVAGTEELDMSVDTFSPRHLTNHALELEKDYYQDSWLMGSPEGKPE